MPTMTRAGYTPPKPKEPVRAPEPPKKKKKRKRRGMSGAAMVSLAVFLVAAVIGVCTIHVYLYTSPYQQTFVPGTMLMGQPLAGMTRENVQALLESIQREYVDTWRFDMVCMDETYTLTAQDAKVTVQAEETLDKLWKPGHEGNMLARYRDMRMLEKEKLVLAQPVMTDELDAAVDALLERIRADVECAPVDATVTFTPGRAEPFTFTDEQTGLALELDAEQTASVIRQSLDRLSPGSMTLEPKVLEPQTYQAELENALSLRARVTVQVTGDAATRQNVALAAEKLNGLRVESGETLSFNETVGARTAESGYLVAAEPAYGADQSGVGGGVCQVSTALHRAALLGGLEVRERSAAARPVDYCDMGQEAAVSDQGLDLVIANATEAPLFVTARVYDDGEETHLELMLIGEELGKRYRLHSLVEETGAEEEPVYVRDREGRYATYTDERVPGGEALPGYTVSLERVTVDAQGLETDAQIVSESVYEAMPPIIYVGVQERDAE